MAKNAIKLLLAVGMLVGVIAIVFSITNQPKTPVTAESVWEIMESQGHTPIDTTEIYKKEWGENGNILTQSIGIKKDDVIFNYFVFDSTESAEYVRKLYQTYIRDNRYFIPNVEIKEGKANHVVYTLEANGLYSVNIRVENTLIFAHSDTKGMDAVNQIIIEMDYFM